MSGRKLVGAPVLLQDWGAEAEEGAAKYWELFLDLLMVAAASAVADGVKENPTLEGINDFLILFFIFVDGWALYIHVTTRFEDGSFLHTMVLFLFIVGNATCIVNASLNHSTALATGALLQRVSILSMFFSVFLAIPRAQTFCIFMGRAITAEIVLYGLVIFFPTYAGLFLWAAVLVGLFLEFLMSVFLRREDLIPINIEHIKDRHGILLLVMLGETVISATIEYRRVAESASIDDFAIEYYWVLFWALVLVFFYALLFFALSPPPAFHAFRRSRLHGCSLLLTHKLLCASVLAVGASVKLTIEAVVEQKKLSDFTINLMSVSVGGSLFLLFLMRMLHYFGIFPTGNEPPDTIRLMHTWWIVLAGSSVLPFLGLVLRIQNPVHSIAAYACLLFGVCLIESAFTHVLEPYLIQDQRVREDEALPLKESEAADVSYDSTSTSYT